MGMFQRKTNILKCWLPSRGFLDLLPLPKWKYLETDSLMGDLREYLVLIMGGKN